MARKNKSGGFGPQGEARVRSQDYEQGLVKLAEPKSRRAQKVTRVILWTFLVLFISVNLSNCTQGFRTISLQDTLKEQVKDTYNPAFKVRYSDLGAQVIESWYNSGPPPVNLSRNISWPSNSIPSTVADERPLAPAQTAGLTKGELVVTDVAFLNGSQKTDTGQSFYQERLNYSALINGVPQQISVTLGVPDVAKDDNYPVLIAAPSILPYKAPGVSSLETKPQGVDADLSDDSKRVIETWARAYTENSSSTLKQSTGDSDAKTAYSGLGSGWKYVPKSVNVAWNIVARDDLDNALVRVTWTMKAPDVTIPASGENQNPTVLEGATQTQTMDLLVSDFKSGNPAVQAWGPVGSYPELKPFQNAINTENRNHNNVNPEDNVQAPVPSDEESGTPAEESQPTPSDES